MAALHIRSMVSLHERHCSATAARLDCAQQAYASARTAPTVHHVCITSGAADDCSQFASASIRMRHRRANTIVITRFIIIPQRRMATEADGWESARTTQQMQCHRRESEQGMERERDGESVRRTGRDSKRTGASNGRTKSASPAHQPTRRRSASSSAVCFESATDGSCQSKAPSKRIVAEVEAAQRSERRERIGQICLFL